MNFAFEHSFESFFEQFRSDNTSKFNQNNRMIFLQVEKPKTKRCH